MLKVIKLKDFTIKEERGYRLNIFDFFSKKKKIYKDLHFVSLKKGKFRGNHKHPNSEEWILLWEGKFEIIWKNKKLYKKLLDVKEPVFLYIPKNVPHLIRNLDEREVFLLSFGSSYPMEVEKEAIINL